MLLPTHFTPGPKDILCGRGNVFSNHEGNRYFGILVRSSLQKYKEASNRTEKIKVVDKILREIRASDGRFAKIDSQTKQWYELNDVQAHQKIGHAIRDTIRLLKDKSDDTKKINNRSSISKRNRQSRPFILPEQMQSSSDESGMILDDFIQKRINTTEVLRDSWGDFESTSQRSRQNHERSVSIGPPLFKDEYPEESFDFSANSFFGDFFIATQ